MISAFNALQRLREALLVAEARYSLESGQGEVFEGLPQGAKRIP